MVTTVTDNSPQSINTSLFSLDKEVQEIKKVTDKLTGINTEANVISVNGKQGIVELNASDVNALPDTTVIPTTTSELENTSGFITSSDSITGNAATATRAEQDANGNVITDTYATKELIANETSERKTADEALQTQITANKNAIDTLNGTGTGSVKKTVTDEIAKVVANAPEDFDTLKEISDWIDTHEDSASAMNTQIQANKNEIASLKTEVAGKSDIGHTHSASDITSGTLPIARGGTGQTTQADINKAFVGGLEEGTSDVTDGTMFVSSYASDNGFADTNAVNVPYKRKFSRVWEYIKGKISSVLGLTASNYGGKASTAGTADYANVPTGFRKSKGDQSTWGNQDGEFITDWETVLNPIGVGDISFRYNAGQLNIIIDGVFYQNEGRYRLVDENSIKTIMKPNYTTGRFPAGAYSSGETVSVSATITTTRGNPVFISYSGDFNTVGSGDTAPWVSFYLLADDVVIQRTVVDNSSAFSSDNTPFAGNALAVLSAGSHTIRLNAVLAGDSTGKIQFQEQENYVNLVAFEL